MKHMMFEEFQRITRIVLQYATPVLFTGTDSKLYVTNCEICGYVGPSTEGANYSGVLEFDKYYNDLRRKIMHVLFSFEIGCCVGCMNSLQLMPLPENLQKIYDLYLTLDVTITQTWHGMSKKYYKGKRVKIG